MTRPVTRQAAAETREKEKKEKERIDKQKEDEVKKRDRPDRDAASHSSGTELVEGEVTKLETSTSAQIPAQGREVDSEHAIHAKDSEKTQTQTAGPEDRSAQREIKVKLPSSGKRRRPPSISPSPDREEKRRRKTVSVIRKPVRPGVPAPVNPRSFVRTDRPSGPDRPDNEDGHFEYALGESITSRYKILSKMGEGTFGRVLECWDRKNKTYVAIKIVRSLPKYRDAAMQELEVLNTLLVNDAEGQHHWVRMVEWFDYRRHVCIVFEKLGLSLFDFLRRNSYFAFHVDLVRQFGRQLLHSVAYLHELNLIHTDLKPENIMLESAEYDKYQPPGRRKQSVRIPRSSAIKLIDFGSAIFDDQHHSSIVCTRHYRAPEVILGLGWSFPVDVWAIGCILVELATGSALFQTHDNMEHLAMMEQVLGQLPERVATLAVRKVADNSKYFKRNRLAWKHLPSSKRNSKAVQELPTIRKMLQDEGHPSVRDHVDDLEDIVCKMMRWEPAKRIKARQALDHPFFSGSIQRADANSKLSETIVLDD